MSKAFNQYSETDPLVKIIIGRYRGYRKSDAYVERVNNFQENVLPSEAKLEEEFDLFSETLKNRGVKVLKPSYVGKFVYDQLTPRDIGVTIGNRFVICNMAKRSRRYEAAGIFKHLLAMKGEEPNILIPPNPNMLLEGGDIIIDKGYIFVGLTNRTNEMGIRFLMDTFEPEFKVIPLPCKRYSQDENVLHLDCVFNPVGTQHALIYKPGLKQIPPAITKNYHLINVDKSAYKALATNILSVNQEFVISRDHPDCHAVNETIRSNGINVISLPFDGAPSTGGSFRCCSLPLVRST